MPEMRIERRVGRRLESTFVNCRRFSASFLFTKTVLNYCFEVPREMQLSTCASPASSLILEICTAAMSSGTRCRYRCRIGGWLVEFLSDAGAVAIDRFDKVQFRLQTFGEVIAVDERVDY